MWKCYTILSRLWGCDIIGSSIQDARNFTEIEFLSWCSSYDTLQCFVWYFIILGGGHLSEFVIFYYPIHLIVLSLFGNHFANMNDFVDKRNASGCGSRGRVFWLPSLLLGFTGCVLSSLLKTTTLMNSSHRLMFLSKRASENLTLP